MKCMVTSNIALRGPRLLNWSGAKCSHSSYCFSAVQASVVQWKQSGHWSAISLMWHTRAQRPKERQREREISHTPFTQTTSLHLFFLLCRSLCALCTAVRTETLGEFYRSGLDIRFLLQCELSVVVSLCANRYSRSSGFLKEQLRYLWLFPFLSRNDSHAAVCKRIQTLQGEHIAVSSILE